MTTFVTKTHLVFAAWMLLFCCTAKSEEEYCFKPVGNPNWVCTGKVYTDDEK